MEKERRIEWCDIFKGIVIVLVVVGHATSRFNQYIYQFHMAAFFFISGYTGRRRDNGESFWNEVCKKCYKYVVPYFTFNLAGIWFFWVLHKAGVLSMVSTIQYPDSFQSALLQMFQGMVYCDWLGAMWFLPVLFLASMGFGLLLRMCRKDSVLILVGLVIFFWALGVADSGRGYWFFDLAGIAQLYLMWGYLARRRTGREGSVWLLAAETVLTAAFWYGIVRMGFHYVVDWPSRNFNGAVDLVLPLPGIWLTICVSRLLEKSRLLKRLLTYLGRNSMGIMCFHFIGFKAAYLVLVLLGRMEPGEMYRLIPWSVAENWWFPISVTAIAFSCLLWRMINNFPLTRALAGGESAGKICEALNSTALAAGVRGVSDFLAAVLRVTFTEYREFLGKRKYFKGLLLTGTFLVCCGITAMKFHSHTRAIEVDFPYGGDMVVFGEGWLPQSGTEDYRWFAERAEFRAFLIGQDELEMRGYIPDNIENISYLSMMVNDVVVYHEPASGGQLIEISLDVSEYVRQYGNNTFVIETDGVRIPLETDADQRILSALINQMKIY